MGALHGMTTSLREIDKRAVEPVRRKSVSHGLSGGRFRAAWIPLHLLRAAASLVMFVPFLWMLFSALNPLDEIFARPPRLLPKVWQPQNFVTAWQGADFARAYFNSIYIAALVAVLTLITCSMAAYAFARIRFPGRRVIF